MRNMKFTFRPYKGSSKGDDDPEAPEPSQNPKERRREQVRRAQRHHRERKEAYIKSLEAEVVQLRASEANIRKQARHLYSELGFLKSILVQNGIPVPSSSEQIPEPDPGPYEPSSDASFVLSVQEKGWTGKQLRAQRAGSVQPEEGLLLSDSSGVSEGQRQPGWRRRGKDPVYPSTSQSPSGSSAARATSDVSASSPKPLPPTPQQQPHFVSTLDKTAIAMEFVLTLESPCFNHVGNPKEAQHAPHGHALMATAPLLLQAPEAPKALLSSHASWQVPDTGIERLLSLSSNLPLDGDVTPIQAWDYIRKQPGFENLELSRLRELTEKLLNFVKCYGFGSVMGQSDFENIVTDTFSRPTPAGYAY